MRDIVELMVKVNGKLAERQGRKATGPKDLIYGSQMPCKLRKSLQNSFFVQATDTIRLPVILIFDLTV